MSASSIRCSITLFNAKKSTTADLWRSLQYSMRSISSEGWLYCRYDFLLSFCVFLFQAKYEFLQILGKPARHYCWATTMPPKYTFMLLVHAKWGLFLHSFMQINLHKNGVELNRPLKCFTYFTLITVCIHKYQVSYYIKRT